MKPVIPVSDKSSRDMLWGWKQTPPPVPQKPSAMQASLYWWIPTPKNGDSNQTAYALSKTNI